MVKINVTRINYLCTLIVIVLFSIAACALSATNPGDTVKAYYEALVAKDQERFVNLICADWEADAMVEFDSFGAVEAELQGLSCETSNSDNQSATVKCQGDISVTYQGEDSQLLSLAENTYQVIMDDGEWRMCGYK